MFRQTQVVSEHRSRTWVDLRMVPVAVAAWIGTSTGLSLGSLPPVVLLLAESVIFTAEIIIVVVAKRLHPSCRAAGGEGRVANPGRSDDQGGSDYRGGLDQGWADDLGQSGTAKPSRFHRDIKLRSAIWLVITVGLVAGTACAVGYSHSYIRARSPLVSFIGSQSPIEASVRISSDPITYQSSRFGKESIMVTATGQLKQFTSAAVTVTQNIAVQLVSRAEVAEELARYKVGQTVTIRARVHQVRYGVATAELEIIMLRNSADPGPLDRAVNAFRGGLADAMAWGPIQASGLTPSLVVGDMSRLDPHIKQDFTDTGLAHLTAVSGTNLTLLLAVVRMLVANLTRSRAIRWIANVCAVVVFIVVCRAEPSVLRAAVMGVIGLAALGHSSDSTRGMRHLSIAVWVLLLLDPWLVKSWGFRLSVTASAGILWWGSRWAKLFALRIPTWLAEAIAIPLAAQLATAPLVIAFSSRVTWTGVIANIGAGPFIGPVTVLSLIAGIAYAVIPTLGLIVGVAATWMIQPVIWIAHWCAGLPGARVTIPVTWWTLTLATLVVFVAAALVPRLNLISVAIFTGAIGMSYLVTTLATFSVSEWDIAICDVGQGDMVMLNTGDGAVVIDVGPDPNLAVECLTSHRVTSVPLLILTHYHYDHVGAIEAVAGQVDVGQIMVTALSSPISNARLVHQVANSRHIPIRIAETGERFQIGKVEWTTVLAGMESTRQIAQQTQTGTGVPPEAEAAGLSSSVENNASIIGIAAVGELTILLPGDAEPEEQTQVRQLRSGMTPLIVDILKLPHHGSSRQDWDFLGETRAIVAVVSADEHNEFRHPAPATVRESLSRGMTVIGTHQGGTIDITKRDGRIHYRQ